MKCPRPPSEQVPPLDQIADWHRFSQTADVLVASAIAKNELGLKSKTQSELSPNAGDWNNFAATIDVLAASAIAETKIDQSRSGRSNALLVGRDLLFGKSIGSLHAIIAVILIVAVGLGAAGMTWLPDLWLVHKKRTEWADVPAGGAGAAAAAGRFVSVSSSGAPDRQTPAPRHTPLSYYKPPTPRTMAGAESGGKSYTVRPGDSLYAISRRTGVSVAELKRVNGITDVRSFKPGVRLSLGGIQAPSTTAGSSIRQPRILKQRLSTPITTKPEQKVAMASSAAPEPKFRWPARGRVIAPFNHTGQGAKNDGINIALPLGTDIGAAEAGVVAYAGSELKGYGNLVLVRHDNGWMSAYAHASEVLVKRGDRIKRGQVIAKAGRSGDVTQPQLHFELRKGAKPVDPMPHMAQM